MDIIIIILISIAAFFLSMFLEKYTKIPNVIFLMIIGVLIGPNFSNLASLLPSISKYSALAIVILFLISGYGLSLKDVKNSSTKTLVLSSVPAFVEGIIIGIVTWLLLTVLNIFPNVSVNFAAVLAVMLVFAMSSPAVIIPFNMVGKERGIKSSIFDEVTIASVIDNFLPFPIILVVLNIAYTIANGSELSIVKLVGQTLGIAVLCVVIFMISALIGKLMFKILNRLNNKSIVAVLMITITSLIFILTGQIGATIGVILGFGIGVGLNRSASFDDRNAIQVISQKIYALTMMPIVFIYIGTQVMFEQLLQPATVATFAFITILAILVKGYVAKWWLKRNGSNEEEANYAFYSFAAKGKVLINISLVIGIGLQANNLDYILQMMYILAAVSIVISFPYSTFKLNKQLAVLKEIELKGYNENNLY